jgi:D-amino-acid oxidase
MYEWRDPSFSLTFASNNIQNGVSLWLRQYRNLHKSELALGINNGHTFTSVCINPPAYLAWLVNQCVKNGVRFKRGVLAHIAEAADAHHLGKRADLVVNCTGLSSRSLGGVSDQKLYPGRGQVVLVRNDSSRMVAISGTDESPDEVAYVITRPTGR